MLFFVATLPLYVLFAMILLAGFFAANRFPFSLAILASETLSGDAPLSAKMTPVRLAVDAAISAAAISLTIVLCSIIMLMIIYRDHFKFTLTALLVAVTIVTLFYFRTPSSSGSTEYTATQTILALLTFLCLFIALASALLCLAALLEFFYFFVASKKFRLRSNKASRYRLQPTIITSIVFTAAAQVIITIFALQILITFSVVVFWVVEPLRNFLTPLSSFLLAILPLGAVSPHQTFALRLLVPFALPTFVHALLPFFDIKLRWSRRILIALMRITLGVCILALAHFASPLENPASQQDTILGLGVVLFGAYWTWALRSRLFKPLSNAVQRFRQQSRLTAQEMLRNSSAQPILYLRPFDADAERVFADNAFLRLLASTEQRRRLEELIADEFSQLAPMIALGKPGLASQPLGVARDVLATTQDNWKDYVRKYIRESYRIVLLLGNTEHVRWELEQILNNDALSKLILILPTTYPDRLSMFDVNISLAKVLQVADRSAELSQMKHARAVIFESTEARTISLIIANVGSTELEYKVCFRTAIWMS
jgi:hypothetical protein